MTDNSLICFKAISNFVSELGELFATKQRTLKLYRRLIDKTTLNNTSSIGKHIEAFRLFCISNRDAITLKDIEKLITHKISYSQRVFIDIAEIFKLSDKDTTKIIWQHLLCISAIVDPAGKAKEILRENLASGKSGKDETNFLTDIISKVESQVDPSANPMEAVSSILKSGIFTDLIGSMNSGLSNGSLDFGKLMGAVQGMVGKLGEQSEGKNETVNMLSSLVGSLDNKSGNMDISGMMQSAIGDLSNGNNNKNNKKNGKKTKSTPVIEVIETE